MTATFIIVGVVLTLLAIVLGTMENRRKQRTVGENIGLVSIQTWDRNWPPITLLVDPSFSQGDRELLDDVMGQSSFLWNKTLGMVVFSKPDEFLPGGHTVPILPVGASVTSGEVAGGEHDGALAFVRLFLTKEGGIHSAAIYLCDAWHNNTRGSLLRAFGHELGHVLGLAHDDYESSIMYPVATARQFRVSERDKVFLEVIYGEDHEQG